jgi:peptidyl-tRNA hydrolase
VSNLYIAVRADLPAGLQLAQVAHAAFAISHDFPSAVLPWLLASNNVAIVSVPNEDALLDLITEASRRGITRVAVREPDLDNEATACAMAPSPETTSLCGALPLALRGVIAA